MLTGIALGVFGIAARTAAVDRDGCTGMLAIYRDVGFLRSSAIAPGSPSSPSPSPRSRPQRRRSSRSTDREAGARDLLLAGIVLARVLAVVLSGVVSAIGGL
ncbi:MAG TPA: hypothetical protein VGR87_13265 [Candidatus Limnocylindria bacterium]|nr:hypothetical protein [Candidatus Limnocylindria bacterium]